MGRDLLAQDYLLKQITASVIYPEGETGKAFWKKVYEKTYATYGTTDIPIDTFNKVWITPEKAVVYENASAGTAYIVESRLKVMLETDYLATSTNVLQVSTPTPNAPNDIAKAILREIVIPVLEKEVNEGANFAPIRQVYQSLLLAAWYKRKIKESILAQAYVDQKKTVGVDISNKNEADLIWSKYVEAFKKGAYNLIKEEFDDTTQETIPRKYFSGGILFNPDASMTLTNSNALLPATSARSSVVSIALKWVQKLLVPALAAGLLAGSAMGADIEIIRANTNVPHYYREGPNDQLVVRLTEDEKLMDVLVDVFPSRINPSVIKKFSVLARSIGSNQFDIGPVLKSVGEDSLAKLKRNQHLVYQASLNGVPLFFFDEGIRKESPNIAIGALYSRLEDAVFISPRALITDLIAVSTPEEYKSLIKAGFFKRRMMFAVAHEMAHWWIEQLMRSGYVVNDLPGVEEFTASDAHEVFAFCVGDFSSDLQVANRLIRLRHMRSKLLDPNFIPGSVGYDYLVNHVAYSLKYFSFLRANSDLFGRQEEKKGTDGIEIPKELSTEEARAILAKDLEKAIEGWEKINGQDVLYRETIAAVFEKWTSLPIQNLKFAAETVVGQAMKRFNSDGTVRLPNIAGRKSVEGTTNPAQNTGGVDLTTAPEGLQTINAGQPLSLKLDPAMLAQVRNAQGAAPVILGIQPLKSLGQFLDGTPK
ncbi:MAG: hypothetical protein HQL20_05915 [Candidatus Omnitrophica bacterium]|nr:hypothetical protein [Candidatus Omnitrophota bacterium]